MGNYKIKVQFVKINFDFDTLRQRPGRLNLIEVVEVDSGDFLLLKVG